MKAAESSVDSTVYRLRAAVETQWYELLANQASLNAFGSYVSSAEQVVKSYAEQFKIGRRSLLDVLNAENELFTARSNVMTTQTDLSLASWRLLSQRGLMAQELGL
jgi:adhesin transport system outer membrane protein